MAVYRCHGLRRLDQSHFIEDAIQIAERDGPAIALVAHEARKHRQRMLRPVFADLLCRTEKRRRIRIVRRLRKEPCDLELGMLARNEAPVHLEDSLVSDDDRAVALLTG